MSGLCAINAPDPDKVRRRSEGNLEKALENMTKHGDTALLEASWDGQTEIVRKLSRAGSSNINTAKWDNLYGCTAVAGAAWTGHIDTVKELLAQKADPNICDNFGRSALDYANMREHHDISKVLIAAGGTSKRH